MFIYRVKITFLNHSNKAEVLGDYSSLFDAISVAKGINIAPSGLTCPALTDEQFNEKFFELLTNGYTYTGRKYDNYPDGNIVLHLVKLDPTYGEEMAIYGEKPLYNVLPAIPQQQREFSVNYRDETGKERTMRFSTQSEADAFLKSCDQNPDYEVLEYNYIK